MGEVWMAEGYKRKNPYPGSSFLACVHLNYLSQMGAPLQVVRPTLEDIFTDVAQSLGVDPVKMKGKRKPRDIAFARIIYCYMACICTNRNQDDVAAIVNLNRSMVSTNRRKLQGYLEVMDWQFEPYWERYKQNSKIYKKYLDDKTAQ